MTSGEEPEPAVRVEVVRGGTLVVHLDGSPGSVRAARLAAEQFLATDAPHVPDRPPAAGAAPGGAPKASVDTLMVVGELVANACRHAPGPCRLTLRCTPSGAEITVRDGGDRQPLDRGVRAPGYGLMIVKRLTGGVRVLSHGGGKTVQATVPFAGVRPRLG
ncbi:ATP-binding protein [Yinghuangia soli]|uniref:ATP-binding protein n=1 Tax=Yinghuangia soli TaxID=2908204 RepID=A0AA41Q8Y4_9ACTN|nr:ATP-binding protein [Yinghuangia soli]MCF2533437.1 ATP-binding protein [Yinghuangia soli]